MTAARATALIGTAITLEIGAAAIRLAYGEISGLPRFLVPFDPWKGGAYQRSMHGTVFDDVRRVSHLVFRLTEPLDLLDLFNALGVLAIVGVRCAAIAGGLDGFLNVLLNSGRAHGRRCRRRSRQDGSRVAAFGDAGEDFLVECPGGVFLSATGRSAAFVGVLGVAGRATSLLDVLFHHGNDRVVRHASLARTIVVHDVTETQPALLH